MRTLIEKELRENFRWLWVGFALIGLLVWYSTPKTLAERINQTEISIAMSMLYGASLFALGLGVMQSFADLRASSRSFLFHRSVSIDSIFYSKLISGAILYFVAAGFPLCFAATWFAAQGIDYLPVRPVQVYSAAVVALACFGFHPATMLMLARSGKWFGTKLLPLLFALQVVSIGLTTNNTILHGPALNALIVGLILLGHLILVAAAKHAWVHSVADEGSFPKQPVNLPLKVTLSVAAIVFVTLFFLVVAAIGESWLPKDTSSVEQDYASDADGNLWWVKSKRTRTEPWLTFISGDRLQKDELPDVRRELPEKLQLGHLGKLTEVGRTEGFFTCEIGSSNRDITSYFDRRGGVLLYDRTLTPPLRARITRDGAPFAGDPRSFNSEDMFFYDKPGPSFWVDPIGAYRILSPSLKVETLLELSIQAKGGETRHTSKDQGSNQAQTQEEITILSDGKLHVYRLTDNDGNEWFPDFGRGKSEFKIREIAVSPPLPPSDWKDIRYHFSDDSKFTVVLTGRRPCFLTYNSKSDTNWTVTPFRNPNKDLNNNFENLLFSVLPLLFSIVVAISIGSDILLNGTSLPTIDSFMYFLQDEYGFVILGTVVVLLSMIVTYYACQRRMLSRSETIRWCCWTVLLGLATPIAILAIYTRPACLRCAGCEKKRRIDLRKCEHCGCDWERPAPMGIEIFDDGLGCEGIREAVSHGG
jgi:hypothetical protein